MDSKINDIRARFASGAETSEDLANVYNEVYEQMVASGEIPNPEEDLMIYESSAQLRIARILRESPRPQSMIHLARYSRLSVPVVARTLLDLLDRGIVDRTIAGWEYIGDDKHGLQG